METKDNFVKMMQAKLGGWWARHVTLGMTILGTDAANGMRIEAAV